MFFFLSHSYCVAVADLKEVSDMVEPGVLWFHTSSWLEQCVLSFHEVLGLR